MVAIRSKEVAALTAGFAETLKKVREQTNAQPEQAKDLPSFIEHFKKAQAAMGEAIKEMESCKSRLPQGKIRRFINELFKTKMFQFEQMLIKNLSSTKNQLAAITTIQQGLSKQANRVRFLGETKKVFEKAIALSAALDEFTAQLNAAKAHRQNGEALLALDARLEALKKARDLRKQELIDAHNIRNYLTDHDKAKLHDEFHPQREAINAEYLELGAVFEVEPRNVEGRQATVARLEQEQAAKTEELNQYLAEKNLNLTIEQMSARIAPINAEIAFLNNVEPAKAED